LGYGLFIVEHGNMEILSAMSITESSSNPINEDVEFSL
jgi:hypothetical protein